MTTNGTAAHTGMTELPPLVRDALTAARLHRFPYSCRPEQGRLLSVLAGGARGRIGETGTGLGVGLAWLTSGAAPGVRLYSVERDPERARALAAERGWGRLPAHAGCLPQSGSPAPTRAAERHDCPQQRRHYAVGGTATS
ncbi:hypothetical protein AB5J72_16395 [Streptomyces sp. CG1]|uniref:hypothetical protein n=1 Tax=Streptomyces sp. CG1 TaxID=1287523 RepID=UPI0034E27454